MLLSNDEMKRQVPGIFLWIDLVVSIIRVRYFTAEIVEADSSVQVLPSRFLLVGPPNPRLRSFRAGNALCNTIIIFCI